MTFLLFVVRTLNFCQKRRGELYKPRFSSSYILGFCWENYFKKSKQFPQKITLSKTQLFIRKGFDGNTSSSLISFCTYSYLQCTDLWMPSGYIPQRLEVYPFLVVASFAIALSTFSRQVQVLCFITLISYSQLKNSENWRRSLEAAMM